MYLLFLLLLFFVRFFLLSCCILPQQQQQLYIHSFIHSLFFIALIKLFVLSIYIFQNRENFSSSLSLNFIYYDLIFWLLFSIILFFKVFLSLYKEREKGGKSSCRGSITFIHLIYSRLLFPLFSFLVVCCYFFILRRPNKKK